jgi:hypothetical protein
MTALDLAIAVRPRPTGLLVLGTLAIAATACTKIPATSPRNDAAPASDAGSDAARDVVVQQPDMLIMRDTNMDACAAESTGAKPVPLDLFVLMDTSRSMSQATSAGPSKWDAVKMAMRAFFEDQQSTGINIGLGYFPHVHADAAADCTTDGPCGTFGPCQRRMTCVRTGTSATVAEPLCASAANCAANETCSLIGSCADGSVCAPAGTSCGDKNCPAMDGYCMNRDICDPAAYTTLAVPWAPLPASAATLTGSLNGRSPDGFTPTGPALSGAIQTAQARAQASPDHKVAMLLVTDGMPGGFIPGMPSPTCTPADVPGIAAIASAAATSTTAPRIPTFVIGVFRPIEQAMATTNLNTLAQAGGTGTAVIITTSQDVQRDLQAALGKIRTSVLACTFQVPPPTSGAVDFNKVNVNFVPGAGGMEVIGYAASKEGCHPTRGGWYFDRDPDIDAGVQPTSIITCDATCTRLQADPAGRVDIALGCERMPIQ